METVNRMEYTATGFVILTLLGVVFVTIQYRRQTEREELRRRLQFAVHYLIPDYGYGHPILSPIPFEHSNIFEDYLNGLELTMQGDACFYPDYFMDQYAFLDNTLREGCHCKDSGRPNIFPPVRSKPNTMSVLSTRVALAFPPEGFRPPTITPETDIVRECLTTLFEHIGEGGNLAGVTDVSGYRLDKSQDDLLRSVLEVLCSPIKVYITQNKDKLVKGASTMDPEKEDVRHFTFVYYRYQKLFSDAYFGPGPGILRLLKEFDLEFEADVGSEFSELCMFKETPQVDLTGFKCEQVGENLFYWGHSLRNYLHNCRGSNHIEVTDFGSEFTNNKSNHPYELPPSMLPTRLREWCIARYIRQKAPQPGMYLSDSLVEIMNDNDDVFIERYYEPSICRKYDMGGRCLEDLLRDNRILSHGPCKWRH